MSGGIIYKRGSLFNAKAPILAHACNAMGVWGSGIAFAMKNRYPNSFHEYQKACHNSLAYQGRYYLTEGVPQILCLVTSYGYGNMKSEHDDILKYTRSALEEFCKDHPNAHVASNRFNAGLFNIPWEETSAILEDVLKDYPSIIWEVWELTRP